MKNLRTGLFLLTAIACYVMAQPAITWAVGEFLTHPQVMSRVSLRF